MLQVYGICYPNGTPFYIGKGQPTRFAQHLRDAAEGSTKIQCEIIRQLQARDVEPVHRNDEIACIEEARLIALYGTDYLANHNDGEKLRTITCLRCKHEWQTRVANPTQCPSCKQPDYDRPAFAPKPLLTCLRCGYQWLSRKANPRQCPGCKMMTWNIPRKEKKQS